MNFLAWLVAAALLALPACGSSADGPPERAPEYAGVVEETDGPAQILVREDGDPCGIWLRVEPDARAFRAAGDGYEGIGWPEVEPGRVVEVWISGPVAESCPAQADAEAVVITR